MTDPMRSRGVDMAEVEALAAALAEDGRHLEAALGADDADHAVWCRQQRDAADYLRDLATDLTAALARAEEAVQRAGEAARDALQEAEEHHGTRNQRDRALARAEKAEDRADAAEARASLAEQTIDALLARNRALVEGLQTIRDYPVKEDSFTDWDDGRNEVIGEIASIARALLAPAQEDKP